MISSKCHLAFSNLSPSYPLLAMLPFQPRSVLLAVLIATLLAVRAVKRKSLTKSGAVAAWCVGFLSVVTGLRGFVLLAFYQIGSSATKYKKSIKQSKDATAAESSARGASQVLACSIVAVALSLIRAWYCGEEAPVGECEILYSTVKFPRIRCCSKSFVISY